MFDNQILSPNEKVKKIRQFFRITQNELAKDICTKSSISLIENNRLKLTFKLAIGIAKNFNKIAIDKKIDIELITTNELMKDEYSQANDIFRNNIIKDLKEISSIDLFEKKLYEAEKIIEKYNITDNGKMHVYKLASDFYYKNSMYTKSNEMCNNGLKVSLDLKDIQGEVTFYIDKSRNNLRQNHYTEALQQLDYAEKISSILSNSELFERIYFNKALVYKNKNNCDKALKYLDLLNNKFKIENQKKLLDIKMLHANCLNTTCKFEEAKNEYIKILELAMKIDDKDSIALGYRNLSELYFKKRNYKAAATFIKESLKNNPNNSHLNENLYFAAKVLKNSNQDVESYLLRALEICEKNDMENLNLIEKIIYELVLIYIKREDEESIMLMDRKTKELNIDYCLIYAELINYYRERNKEKSIYFNKQLINKIKQIKKIKQ